MINNNKRVISISTDSDNSSITMWEHFRHTLHICLVKEGVKVEYLSCVRRGLLVWTGVGGPDMSEGVEHVPWPSLWALLKDPWVM